eukprot:TRINITY_DN42778_c0_g1_i1.p1 TRINITY_DN42778_c0_g1~~TRINITY_DN42778_c0_g1_i1.p1  ORF type:complete len:280 (+),score=21.37 TRINITY_DN42778_c0_g1_i1:105-944(+)
MLCRTHCNCVQLVFVVTSCAVVLSFDYGELFITSTRRGDPKHTIIVCNAYADTTSMHVINAMTQEDVMGSNLLSYKACAAADVVLKNGDQLDFITGTKTVGGFVTTKLPEDPSTLVITPYRRGLANHDATFKSHIFSSSDKAQVAIIDASTGRPGGSVQISPHDEVGDQPATEYLEYDHIIAVSPCKYQFSMVNNSVPGGDAVQTTPVSVALSGAERVVVLRVGGLIDDTTTNSPQKLELIIYTHGGGYAKSGAHSVSSTRLFSRLTMVATVVTVMFDV